MYFVNYRNAEMLFSLYIDPLKSLMAVALLPPMEGEGRVFPQNFYTVLVLKSQGGVVKAYLSALLSAKLTPPDQVYSQVQYT